MEKSWNCVFEFLWESCHMHITTLHISLCFHKGLEGGEGWGWELGYFYQLIGSFFLSAWLSKLSKLSIDGCTIGDNYR